MSDKLYKKLLKEFNQDKLKNISSKIISFYKNKQFRQLITIAEHLKLDISNIKSNLNKIFSKIIIIYHPDRIKYYQKELESNKNNSDKLNELLNIIEIDLNKRANITFESEKEEYTYDINDFDFVYENTENENIIEKELYDEYGFLEAVRSELFGNTKGKTINQPLLEMLEGELNLSAYEIEDIKGIEFCRAIESLNLSNNNIENINRVSGLHNLEYLYLSNNHIEDISVLGNLHNLKELDLSFNEIEDVSILLNLDKLEYLNIIGNPIEDMENILKNKPEEMIIIY